MLCYDGRVSLISFLSSSLSFCGCLFLTYDALSQFWISFYLFPILHFILINIIIKLLYEGHAYQIAIRAVLLGFLFSMGIYIKLLAPSYIQIFGAYMCVMSIFHYSEFLTMAYIQPKLVSTDSFVINHSLQYTIAAIASWFEFGAECYFLPNLKTIYWLSNVGLIICIVGELLRKVAMLTAHSNFNHLVQCEKSDDHVLVTHGVYAWFRHPSYVGWFYWSIATQIILVNPFCIMAYAVASWYFFKERIALEEVMLLNFFGQQYYDYQQKVGTGLPLIEGYKM